MDVSQLPDQPVAHRREIYGLWLTSFGAGPMSSVLIIFLQLLVVKQTKYLASRNDEWIEWRDKFIDGDICGPPRDRNSSNPYGRPEGMDDDCQWFPTNKEIPGLGLDYTNILVFGTAIILFLTGAFLIVLGPLGDFGCFRRQLLVSTFVIWIPFYISVGFIGKPSLYWIVMILAVIASVAYGFGLKGPFASYIPLLIESHWRLYDLKKQYLSVPSSTQELRAALSGSISANDNGALSHGNDGMLENQDQGLETKASQDSGKEIELMPVDNIVDTAHDTVAVVQDSQDDHDSGTGVRDKLEEQESMKSMSTTVLISGTEKSDQLVTSLGTASCTGFKQQYLELHESVAGQVPLRESASFITGQLIGLLLQFGVVLLFRDDDNPRNTLGERLAVIIAAIWAAVFGSIGLFQLKDREGPPFPPGNKYLIGFMRSLKTLNLMHHRLPKLLSLMVGRMLVWLGIQTVLVVFALFLEREFSLTTAALGPLLLCYFVAGALSAFGTSVLVSKLSGYTLLIFKVYTILATLLPLYILIGVREKAELYLLMVVAAVLLAPFPSLVRAMMANMIPEGYTATIMSLEGLIENATTWIGPVVTGVMLEITNSMRWSIFALVVFMIGGMPFIWAVKMDVAHQQKIELEKWNRTESSKK